MQANTPPFSAETLGKVVLWGFLSLPLLEKVWGWATGGARKEKDALRAEINQLRTELSSGMNELEESIGQFVDKEALEKRFGGIDDKHKLLAADVLNQHNTLHEFERERERLKGEYGGAITQLQREGRALEPLPGQVADLKAKFDALTNQINDLKTGQRELRQEMRQDMQANKSEIIDAIKSANRSPH